MVLYTGGFNVRGYVRGYKVGLYHTERQSGFTLIELVSVIVILSIIAVIGSSFVASSMQMYQQSQDRAKLINKSRQAIERMTRQIRGAVPHSWRLLNGGNCIEFLPIASGGNYLDILPDAANSAPASALILTSPYQVEFSQGDHVTVGAMAATEIYGVAAVSRADTVAPVTGNGTSINLSASKQWRRNSINQRFFLAAKPQAFCLEAGVLNFYDNLNVNDSGLAGGASQLLAIAVTSSTSAFSISAGTEDRSVVLNMNLSFSEAGETVDFLQEVSLRNVP